MTVAAGPGPEQPPVRGLPAQLAFGLLLGAVVLAQVAAQPSHPFSVAYSFLQQNSDGTPYRWNPCEPIRYVVNPDGAPDGAMGDVRNAMRRVSAQTGIPFVSDGVTDEIPVAGRSAYQPERYGFRWAPLLIGWIHDEESDIPLHYPRVGAGFPIAVRNALGRPVYVSGWLALNADLAPGTLEGESLASIVQHELGHVVGLGHVHSPQQIMFPTAAEEAQTDWGPGDRLGLFLVGSADGCIDEPVPSAAVTQLGPA